ncbi:unnamed protein product [Rhizoctonia solani]|uniref:TPX2 C-terminal domain-containing protein n=1 Tax=Rhizoctonia solani TaxID=456999 RepID=A0A8H3GWE2_9AGAM|nr:unnamed protein product [Rhizoctonia solani]
MPREVFLEPSGSPFVHSGPYNHDQSFGDSTLTDLSFQVQDNDNLLNASGFAGLADVTAGGIGDDTSMMKMPGVGSESEDMLMGVKGDEFLADDSMAFELSKSTQTRSKLDQSTSVPPAPIPAPVEEEEKPKRKKSTRSRSSSPSKKRSSAATTPAVEEAPTFPTTQIETMPEEPEPEPEPKLRRSPRKARSTSTRMGSISTGPSPFASTSSQPSSQPTPEKSSENAQAESSPAPETPAEPEPEPEPKTKRTSRTVGRSKSKSRAKSARVEEPFNEESPKAEEPAPVAEPTVSTPVVERETTPIARTPISARETTPVPPPQTTLPASSPAPVQTTPPTTSQSPQIPIQATSRAAAPVVPPTSRPAPTTRHSMAPASTTRPTPAPTTRQSLAPAPTNRQSLAPTPGPAPFKFNLPPSFGRRTQSLAPTPVTPSHAPSFPTSPFPVSSTPGASNPVSALPSPALALATPSPAIASDPPSATASDDVDDLTYEQLSKEEEEEAVAAAMRITRRDSSIFGLMSPLRAAFARDQDVGMDGVESSEENTTGAIGGNTDGLIIEGNANAGPVEGTTTEGSMENNATGPDTTAGNVSATEPAPVPKRTRVGRGSTRGRGGAAVAVAVMGRVVEDEDMERVETLVEPQGQEQKRALEQEQYEQEEKHIIDEHQDAAVPVNFGSRSPSPTPPPPPPGEPGPSANLATDKPKPSFGTRTRTTRASMPTVQPARTTRSTRRSEVQAPTSRGPGTTAIKETLVEKPTEVEKEVQNDNDKPTEDVSTPIRTDLATPDSTTPLEPALHDVISATHDAISTTPLDSPVVSAPEGQATAPQKAVGSKGPQRVATRAASAAVASQRTAPASGPSQSQPRRAASGSSTKPPSTGSAKPPSTGAKPASTEGPQRDGPAQKPASTKARTSRKPASTEDKPPSATHKEDVVEQEPAPVLDPDVPKNEPEPEVRAVRALPKRASRSSQVPTIMEDSMEISREEIGELGTGPAQVTPVQNVEPISMPASIWPREPAPNPFAPVNTSLTFNDDSPRTNKRRAPSSEPELESTPQATDSNDSPNKRVRFTAVLEAGPTPGIGRVLHMPKPSLKKVKKFKVERKANGTGNANRPKRVLTRDWVVGHTPSYAAPLKRDVREREATTAERPPLIESQANTRTTASKLNPTVPIPFTFRSELRMKSQPTGESHLPAAIPIASPMPDFAVAHAAAEAANLARRQRAQEVFLAAQAELESYRNAKYVIGGETARRAAERAVFDAAMKVKEAEAERVRNEQKRTETEKEAAEIRDMRRRMVPKANPVPEFYKYAPRNDAQDLEA